MRKRWRMLGLVALAVLVIAGCGLGDRGGTADLDAHSVKPVMLPAERKAEAGGHEFVRLDGVPEYYRVAGWLDQKRLIGLSRERVTVFDVMSGAVEDLGIHAWNVWLSPDRKTIAFNNEAGLSFATADGTKPGMNIPPGEMGVPDGVVWSPDSRRIVYRVDHEWDSVHYVLDLDTGAQQELHTRLDGYFMNRAVAWPTPSRILFQTVALVGLDGTREYTEIGYRGDLAVLDVDSGEYSLISSVEDGGFIVFQGLTKEQAGPFREIVFILKDPEQGSREWGLLGLDGNKVKVQEVDRKVTAVQIPDGKTSAYFFREAGTAGDNMRLELLNARTGDWTAAVTIAEITCESGFFTFVPAPDADRAVLGFALIERTQDGFQTKEYLYLMTEK